MTLNEFVFLVSLSAKMSDNELLQILSTDCQAKWIAGPYLTPERSVISVNP